MNQLVGLDDYMQGLPAIGLRDGKEPTSPCANLLETGLGGAPNLFDQSAEWWANFWTAYFGYGKPNPEAPNGVEGLDEGTLQKLYAFGVNWWHGQLNGKANKNALFFPSMFFGGPFTDDYGNRVFIYTKGALVPQDIQKKYWGFSDFQKECVYVQVRNLLDDLQDTGWRMRWVEEFCSPSYNRRGDEKSKRLKDFTSPRENHLTRRLLAAGYPTSKVDKPIFVHLHRDVETGIPNGWLIALGAAAALAIAYLSLGTGSALTSSLMNLLPFAKGDKKKLGGSDLKNLVSAIIPGNSTIGNFVKDGLSLYDAKQSGSYGQIANILGVKEVAGMPTSALDLVGKSSKGYNSVNALLSVAGLAGTADGMTDKLANGQLGAELASLKTMTKSPEMTGLMLANSMQGYSSLVPTNVGGNDAVAAAIQYCKGDIGNNPDIHKALIDVSQGLPANGKAFDNLVLAGLKNQAIANAEARGASLTGLSAEAEAQKKIRIALPAGLPEDKKNCFAQALAADGFEVIIGGVDSGESAAKAGKYIYRLEWQ